MPPRLSHLGNFITLAMLATSLPLGANGPGSGYQEPMDDRRTLGTLEKNFNELVKTGKLTTSAELAPQKSRTMAKLILASREDHARPGRETASPTLAPADIAAANTPGCLIFLNSYLCDKCHNWHLRPAGAWVLTKEGAIVTNYHVLESGLAPSRGTESPGMAVADVSGHIYPVREILAASEVEDIAILRVEASGLKPIPIETGSAAGDPVYLLSNPQQRLSSFTSGMISRYFVYQELRGKPVTRLAVTADYATGSSGSPLFNSRGAVIGMVSSTSSLYTEKTADAPQGNLQMVVKNCVPAEAVLKMIGPP